MKVALVSGGSSGIGRQICLDLRKEGYKIFNASRRFEGKDEKININKLVGVEYIKCDVSDLNDILNLRKELVEKYELEKLDVLINNVGIMKLVRFEETTEEYWNEIINTNLKSHYFMTKIFLDKLLRAGGVVVSLASISGIRGEPGDVIYGISKAGLINMTKSLCRLYGDRVRFNCISPGLIDTKLIEGPPNEDLIKEIPRSRIGKTKEVSSMVLSVVKNDYVNGENIVVDGGVLCD